jgi:hypothetical protein
MRHNVRLVSQEIIRFLWNSKVNAMFKSACYVLSRATRIQSGSLYIFRRLYSHLRLDFPHSLFTTGFTAEIVYSFLISLKRASNYIPVAISLSLALALSP